jgi:hypothetical protein
MQVGLTASAYVKRGELRKQVLFALDMPRTPTELAGATGIRWGYVNAILRDFRKLDLVSCLNPHEGTGRLYRLTARGTRLRTALGKDLSGFNPYKEPSGFDWKVYAAIVRGRQRRAFLRAMDTVWRTREEIRKQALQFNDRIWRPNAYDVLRFLLRLHLIEVSTTNGKTCYRLTNKGLSVKGVLS